jgi:hypothetical protein
MQIRLQIGLEDHLKTRAGYNRVMKKIMIADVVKAVAEEIESEEDSAIREEVAESLGVEPGDVDDDDVENYLSMGGNKGEMQSSIGPIQWIYDNTLKAYIVYLVLETAKGPRDIIYRLDRDMMKQWKDSSSIGEHYNNIIRGNKNIEEPPACGCGPNPCEPGQIDQFKNKYASLS